MAGVPEIEPSEQATAQPAPVIQAPPLGVFSGEAVGQGLGEIGKEVFATGMGAYHMAAEATAQAAETRFQTDAVKILEKYKTQYGWSAVQSHPQVTQELAQARQSALESLPSKLGRQYFNNSTLRIHRYAQESADSHFEQQNKIFQFGAYKQKQAADLGDLRTYAADQKPGGKAEDYEKRLIDRATNQYGALTGDQEAVDAEVHRVKTLIADTVLRSIADKGGDAVAALKKYGALASGKALDAAQSALFEQRVDSAQDEIFKDIKRLDTSRKEDPSHGMLDATQVRERLTSRPRDQYTEELTKRVNKELAGDAQNNKDYAEGLNGQIQAILNKGGKVPDSLWADLNNAGPLGAKLFKDTLKSYNMRVQNETKYTKWQQDTLDKSMIRQASWELLGSQNPADRKLFTKDQMLSEFNARWPGASAYAHKALSDEYDKWQKQDDKSFESQAAKLAKDAVLERWGNIQRHGRDLAQLHEYLKNRKGVLEGKTDDVIMEQAKRFLASDRSEAPTVVSRERAAPEVKPKPDVPRLKAGDRAAYDALPKGAQYYDSQGNLATKGGG